MTTIFITKVCCALCGKKNEFEAIGSSNAFGSSDLDTRPPEMMRSTIDTWVQRCSDCGYCNADINESRPGFQAVVQSTEYRKQLNDEEFPELTNSFLSKAILNRETGDFSAATWALIHAAWTCDDANLQEKAVECRLKASEMLLLAEERGQQVAEQKGAGAAILVDLLRRARHMDAAKQVIIERRNQINEEIIVRILDFQEQLIAKGDSLCHQISEVSSKNE